jgi:sigma-B regulation protein RsbU (phosphoserine phosphatase)
MKILESTLPKTRLAETSKNYHLQEITSSLFAQQINLIYPELSQFNIEVIVPMQLQGETKGLIILGRRGNKLDYTESDIEFISSLGSLAIVSLENKRLFKEALEKQRLEEELEIAKDIQRNLLPGTIPELRNFDIAASTISSKQVGGDYYDIISLEDNMYCVSIGDVSGKGVPAALLMANLQAFLKSICKQGMKLEIATGVINDLISENTSDGRFITFFWGIINDEKRTFSFVNAGHNPPVLIRNGEITYLSKGGMLLGVMKTLFPYEREDLTLQKDDLIVMFTDGITEAKNAEDEEFSDERLEILLKEVVTESSENIMKRIKKELENFTKGYPQSDDITMMVIKVK